MVPIAIAIGGLIAFKVGRTTIGWCLLILAGVIKALAVFGPSIVNELEKACADTPPDLNEQLRILRGGE